MSQALIPLLARFRAGQLAAPELQEQLSGIVSLCERKIAALNQTRILPADAQEWGQYLRPALELAYQGLIAAARLGHAYADQPSPEIAEGIVYTLMQVDKATGFVEGRLGGVSTETRSALSAELSELGQEADSSQLGSPRQGQAQAALSLFND